MGLTYRFAVPFAGLAALIATSALAAQQESVAPEANPGRPSVSVPATLPPVGYMQYETGTLYAAGAPGMTAQLSLNQVTRLAFTSRVGVFTSWEPLAHSSWSRDAVSSNTPGGDTLGVQAVLLPNRGPRPAVAVSYIRSLYGGKAPDLDVGSTTQSAQLLVGIDVAHFHADINGIAGEQMGGSIRRAQFGQTLCVSRGFGRWTAAGEVWHFTLPVTHGHATGNLWAGSYALRPNLVLDAGFNHGLTAHSVQWEGFAGFTYLMPRRLWHSPF